MIKRKYGWIPEVYDSRDRVYLKGITQEDWKTLPVKVDLRDQCSPVENQGSIGSCVAQALVGNLELLLIKNKREFDDLSRLFAYYNVRKIEGNVQHDSGATIRGGIKALRRWGVCEEALWPYKVSKFKDKPPVPAYKDANRRLISKYMSIPRDNVYSIHECLATGYPVVLGITLYESFESKETASTGRVKMPRRTERAIGGHAIMIVGYDTTKKHYIVRNSWGTKWGMDGYFILPMRYVDTYGADLWTVRA